MTCSTEQFKGQCQWERRERPGTPRTLKTSARTLARASRCFLRSWRLRPGFILHFSCDSSPFPAFPALPASPHSPLRGPEYQDSMFRLNSASPFDQIQALYRLLLIRTGHRIEAENALRQIFSGSLKKSGHETGNAEFAEFFRAALRLPATRSDSLKTELDGWPLALHRLPEPERSAITLFYLEIFSPTALGNILGVGIQELAGIIETARNSLEVQRPNSDTKWN